MKKNKQTVRLVNGNQIFAIVAISQRTVQCVAKIVGGSFKFADCNVFTNLHNVI